MRLLRQKNMMPSLEMLTMAEYINRKALLKKAWDADTRIGYAGQPPVTKYKLPPELRQPEEQGGYQVW